jgi:hypothetical protein
MAVNEKRLATLIRRRDRLAAELADTEKRVRAAINEFSRERGFLIPLRIEKVRPLLGMDSHGRTTMH